MVCDSERSLGTNSKQKSSPTGTCLVQFLGSGASRAGTAGTGRGAVAGLETAAGELVMATAGLDAVVGPLTAERCGDDVLDGEAATKQSRQAIERVH